MPCQPRCCTGCCIASLLLARHDATMKLYEELELVGAAVRREQDFTNVEAGRTVTRWEFMEARVNRVMPQISDANLAIGDFLATPDGTGAPGGRIAARGARSRSRRLEHLATADLERLMAEHIDLCSYRLDAWQSALFSRRLERAQPAASEPRTAACRSAACTWAPTAGSKTCGRRRRSRRRAAGADPAGPARRWRDGGRAAEQRRLHSRAVDQSRGGRGRAAQRLSHARRSAERRSLRRQPDVASACERRCRFSKASATGRSWGRCSATSSSARCTIATSSTGRR